MSVTSSSQTVITVNIIIMITLNNNIYYLTKLTNTNKDTVTIFYDTSNRISKITDENCKEVLNSLLDLTKGNKKPKVIG